MPRGGAVDELASLKAHAEFFRQSRESGLEVEPLDRERILHACETAYAAARYSLPSDWLEKTHFYRVVYDLEFRSSPGYPYCLASSTIGDWLGWNGVGCDGEKLEELWFDVLAFLSGERDSFYRVFIKSEPHTLAKRDAGRWRLIICPPLYEQVAWTMVFGPGNDREIETVGRTPSMQGMSLPGGLWKDWLAIFQQRGLNVAMDKSAWDWTAHEQLISMDLELRHRLLTGPNRGRWRQLAERLYDGAFNHPRLVLSSGAVYQQTEPGVMKSGCVNTISSNSHMQVFVHCLACLRYGLPLTPLPVAVGDDTLSSLSNLVEPSAYRFTGAVVKEVDLDMHFVGHRWYESGPVPTYSAKHFVRFAVTGADYVPDFLDSMVRLYAHHEGFQKVWRWLAYRRGIDLPSEAFVKFWYDYPDDVIQYYG
ncbi:hypothetical protein [Hubei sobemo-like virus 43]|uniref:hypothetical protein n=1 Tax=Hubei sobemo-like virus 43 TaxID=1923231 RepID=UPI00090953D6|nr:hypothetical protein [Hubei sobemo-like virus 43]APG75636.1 hypothetical protein [Hubei sobemo-like virus 43]